MTTFFLSSINEKTLLESSPRSGWVCTKLIENSNIRPQEAHLTDFEDGTRLIGGPYPSKLQIMCVANEGSEGTLRSRP